MTYKKKDIIGRFEAELVTIEELNYLVEYVKDIETKILSIEKEGNNFLRKENYSEVINQLNEIEKIKAGLINEFYKFAEINRHFEELKQKEFLEFREALKKNYEFYQDQLSKQFLLELGKPISEKNKEIKKVLQEFYNSIKEGIDDYRERDSFINKLKEVLESIDLHQETKINLLEWATNDFYWDRGNNNYNNEWSNENLKHSLRKLINGLTADCDSGKLKVFIRNNQMVCKSIDYEKIIDSEEENLTGDFIEKKKVFQEKYNGLQKNKFDEGKHFCFDKFGPGDY